MKLLILLPILAGCAGAMVASETARIAGCEAAEQRVEDLHEDGTFSDEEAFARIDGIRLVCDEIHERIVAEDPDFIEPEAP